VGLPRLPFKSASGNGRDDPGRRIVVALVGRGCLDLSVAALACERIIASGEQVPAIDLAG
jgi:ornithine cyclodeaminase/alanine dehydrogenase-like protein (mu-crystallin family)